MSDVNIVPTTPESAYQAMRDRVDAYRSVQRAELYSEHGKIADTNPELAALDTQQLLRLGQLSGVVDKVEHYRSDVRDTYGTYETIEVRRVQIPLTSDEEHFNQRHREYLDALDRHVEHVGRVRVAREYALGALLTIGWDYMQVIELLRSITNECASERNRTPIPHLHGWS